MKKLKPEIRASKSKQDGYVWIYSEIGQGYFDGVTASDFSKEIRKLESVNNLHVYINSPGGDVFEGIAIFNILKRNRAKVIVEIDALAASIASLIAMAGDEIRMAENALMMIHNPWGMVIGDVNDFAKAIEDLNRVKDSSMLPAYQKQTGLEDKKLSELMDAETWMSAKEAKEYGFIDKITDGKPVQAKFDFKKFNFKNKERLQKFKIQDSKKTSLSNLESWKWRLKLRRYRINKNRIRGGGAMI